MTRPPISGNLPGPAKVALKALRRRAISARRWHYESVTSIDARLATLAAELAKSPGTKHIGLIHAAETEMAEYLDGVPE